MSSILVVVLVLALLVSSMLYFFVDLHSVMLNFMSFFLTFLSLISSYCLNLPNLKLLYQKNLQYFLLFWLILLHNYQLVSMKFMMPFFESQVLFILTNRIYYQQCKFLYHSFLPISQNQSICKDSKLKSCLT